MFNDVKGNDNSTIMIHVDFRSVALCLTHSHSHIHKCTHIRLLSCIRNIHMRTLTVTQAEQKRDGFFSPFNGFHAIHIAHVQCTSSANHLISPSYDYACFFLWFLVSVSFNVCMVCFGIILDCIELCDNDHNG